MKAFLLLSFALTVTLAVPVQEPDWEPVSLDEGLPPADVLPEQGHVAHEDIKPSAGQAKALEPAGQQASAEGPAVEKIVAVEEEREEKAQQTKPEEPESDSNLLPEEEPVKELVPKNEAMMGLKAVDQKNAIVQEVHPLPGRPKVVEEPAVEVEPEEEAAWMPESFAEEDDVSVGEEEEDEEAARPEDRVVMEEPSVELESLSAGEEESTVQDDEAGTEAQPEDEEEVVGEEGPVAEGQTVVDLEPSAVEGEEDPETEPETEPEDPALFGQSSIAQRPLLDGFTLKLAKMEEEPDMWVGTEAVPDQDVEEDKEKKAETDEAESAAAVAAGEQIDTDDRMLVNVAETPSEEDAKMAFYERNLDGRLNNEGATERRYCEGVTIDGRCYQFFRGPKQAWDAEFYCQDHFPNGHLASVTDTYIHQQMMSLMAQNGGYTRTWIGGLRYLDTGRFIWLDGAQWQYADWLAGEPNDTAGIEDCVELLSDSKFNDMPCRDYRAFICSYPV